MGRLLGSNIVCVGKSVSKCIFDVIELLAFSVQDCVEELH